jgi:hypothetical protein
MSGNKFGGFVGKVRSGASAAAGQASTILKVGQVPCLPSLTSTCPGLSSELIFRIVGRISYGLDGRIQS